MGSRVAGTDCLVEITLLRLGEISDEARVRAEDSVWSGAFAISPACPTARSVDSGYSKYGAGLLKRCVGFGQ